jgi:hypothetical protein
MLSKQEIEQAAKEYELYSSIQSPKHGFIRGATMVNELQPYTAKDMKELLSALDHLCHNAAIIQLVSKNSGTLLEESHNNAMKLIKLWEEQRNG